MLKNTLSLAHSVVSPQSFELLGMVLTPVATVLLLIFLIRAIIKLNWHMQTRLFNGRYVYRMGKKDRLHRTTHLDPRCHYAIPVFPKEASGRILPVQYAVAAEYLATGYLPTYQVCRKIKCGDESRCYETYYFHSKGAANIYANRDEKNMTVVQVDVDEMVKSHQQKHIPFTHHPLA